MNAALILLAALAQDWPQFRGPGQQGHAEVKRLPLQWNDASSNLAWRAAVPGLGWSSPVHAGGRIWLSTSTGEGRIFHLLCLDAGDGRILHDVELFRRDAPLAIHKKNSHASPTPLIDGERIYVHFGTYGTACVAADGAVIWKRQIDYPHVHGPGPSPVLANGLLVLVCDAADAPFLVALDAKTGEIRWKIPRPASEGKRFSFCTPLVWGEGEGTRLLSPGANGVQLYDLSGKAHWNVPYPGGYSVVPRPVRGHGLVYLSTGYDRPQFLAVREDGSGVAWTLDKGAPLNPSPLLVGDEIYLVSDGGVATCADAKTGKVHWQERLGGNFSASLLHGAGRIYALDEAGATTVFAPGREFRSLGKNAVKGRTLATPAPMEGALLLRTDTQLLKILAE
jgi:outer membrane protein assembly factor BamB